MSSVSEAQKKQEQEQKAQALQVQYNKFQEAVTELQTQLSSITSQIQEHNIVDKTLTSIPPNERNGRKCFKMIGGVLVDKSVDEVIKILNDELKQLGELKSEIEKSLVKTRTQMDEWMKKNNVKIVRGNQG